MLCQSAELGITSSTCKGGISNITDVILICLAGGFSVTTLFSVAQIRYFARYKEPLDSEVQHCMSDLAEQIIAVLCTAIRFGSYATPALLAYTNNEEEDTTFAAVAVGIVGYICAVGMRGRTGWKHAAGHLLASLGGVCLMRAWQPLVVPRIAEYPGVCTALVVVSALALMGFTVNILKQEHMFLRYGFWAFIAAMFVGYGAVVYDVVVTADSDTLLWYTVLGVCASGVLYAALWTFFPGTAAPRTSYITFHIAAVLCMLAPFPVLLFAQDREEAPLVLIAALVCYHFGCFLYIADLPTYNSRVVLYRTLMYCMLAKFMTVVFGGGGDSSVNVSDTNSLFEVVSVLARGYAGPIVVISFAVLSVYQIARKQGPNGPNMFEQGALVASLVVFGVYAGGPAVAAGAALVLHLREPRVAWDVYGPKVFDAAKDAAVGIVVCVALAVYSVVNRSFIINTERERRRQYIKELEKRKQEKKTQ